MNSETECAVMEQMFDCGVVVRVRFTKRCFKYVSPV